MLSSSASWASSHGPSSMRTSTRATPRCCAQATPATATRPAATAPRAEGTSIRELVLIGPSLDQPRGIQ